MIVKRSGETDILGSSQTDGVPLDQAAPSIRFAHVGAAIERLASGIACRPCALPLVLNADIDRAGLVSFLTVRTALPLAVQLDRLNGVALVLGKVLAGIIRPAAGGLSAGERERVRITGCSLDPFGLQVGVTRRESAVHLGYVPANSLAVLVQNKHVTACAHGRLTGAEKGRVEAPMLVRAIGEPDLPLAGVNILDRVRHIRSTHGRVSADQDPLSR